MPIQLTTPLVFDPGHGEVSEQYSQLRIIRVVREKDTKQIHITTQYGNTVKGDWVAGKVATKTFTIENRQAQLGSGSVPIEADPAYDDLTGEAKVALKDNLVFGEEDVAFYQWLLAKGFYAGTITVKLKATGG